MAGPLIALALRLTQAEQNRARAIKEAATAKRAGQMMGKLRDEAAINAAILQYGEGSLRVRELQIAAERRAFEQTLQTMNLLPKVRAEMMAASEAARGLASADQSGTTAAGSAYLKDQRERIEKLRLEQQLLGLTAGARARLLALWQAERDMLCDYIELRSARAAEIRAAALKEAEFTTALERQSGAWGKVQSSAESAIDGVARKLMLGDMEGALESLVGDIAGMFTELAQARPAVSWIRAIRRIFRDYAAG